MIREPLLIVNAVVILLEAVLALIVAFGVELTQEQTVAIMAVIGAAATLVQTIVGRAYVSPVDPDRQRDGPE